MVFVSDFEREFYDVIKNQGVLIISSLDVDALCACNILRYLFKCDNIRYTMKAAPNKNVLEKIYMENCSSYQYVILLNCGASLDIVELFQPTTEKVFFVCDSHRPIDVHNIYNQVQVKLLIKEREVENIPGFDLIFRDEDESDDDGSDFGDDPDSELSVKRRRLDEDALERRRERRLWEQNRQETIFEYTQYTSWGSSSALLLYKLCWKMSKETNDLLWLAIIGVTEQFIMDKINRDLYIASISLLQPHVLRFNPKPTNGESANASVSHLKIIFTQEIQMSLYRHWTIMDSLTHSRYLACKFVIWSLKGKKKLNEFFAEMGLSKTYCNQNYINIEPKLTEPFKEIISKYAPKYGVSEHELLLPSFLVQFGYTDKFCAADVARGCDALLHSVNPVQNKKDSADDQLCSNFFTALDSLSRDNTTTLRRGIEHAKQQLTTLVSQVQSILDMNQIVCVGSFLYSIIQQSSLESQLFTRPSCLHQLAKFTLEAYCANSRNKKAKYLPMILGIITKQKDIMLLVGVPPFLDKDKEKNCFGKAFEQAAISAGSRVSQPCFESFVVELRMEDKSRFFDTMTMLLQDSQ